MRRLVRLHLLPRPFFRAVRLRTGAQQGCSGGGRRLCTPPGAASCRLCTRMRMNRALCTRPRVHNTKSIALCTQARVHNCGKGPIWVHNAPLRRGLWCTTQRRLRCALPHGYTTRCGSVREMRLESVRCVAPFALFSLRARGVPIERLVAAVESAGSRVADHLRHLLDRQLRVLEQHAGALHPRGKYEL